AGAASSCRPSRPRSPATPARRRAPSLPYSGRGCARRADRVLRGARGSLARALALDPELLFLDEPTAGLDPIGAAAFDELTRNLQHTLGLTVFLITHDLDSLYA